MKSLEYLKISSLLLFIIIFSSCNKDDARLNGVSLITSKKVIINDKGINTSSTHKFNNNNYPLEEDTYFDSKGKIIKYGKSKAEGLLFYYRNPTKLQLGLSSEQLNFELKIDTINHLIIENKDTIRAFKVNYNNGVIYSENRKTNRINIYNFK